MAVLYFLIVVPSKAMMAHRGEIVSVTRAGEGLPEPGCPRISLLERPTQVLRNRTAFDAVA